MEQEPLCAEITRIGDDLTGRATVNGKSFSFRYVQPGDRVFFRFLGRGKRRWNKILSLEKNSDQSSVQCKFFGACGGCSGQHLPYPDQFRIKTEQLVQKYKSTWDLDVDLVPASRIYHYRNRMDFSVFPQGLGQRESGNFRKVVDIDYCHIQSDWANQEWAKIRSFLSTKPELPMDRKSDSGCLKYVTLRTAVGTDDTMCIFTFDLGFRDSEPVRVLQAWALENLSAKNIVFCFNPRPSEVSAMGECEPIRGNLYYSEKILGQSLQVPFDAFFQPNPNQFLSILSVLKEYLEKSGKDSLSPRPKTFLDFFSGSGFFSLLLGDSFENIYGYEVFAPAVQTANQIVSEKFPQKNVKFETIDLFQKKKLPQFLASLAEKNLDPKDCILVLDPPRNGAGNLVLDLLTEWELETIFYVSCNPKQQWEELMGGLGHFYEPVFLRITDPYPHTPHLESVAILKRKKRGSFLD
jgi:tRNA/tmRNA/rRNA uracil-C5-methylase (TrmA/RlmC/RlmD family)